MFKALFARKHKVFYALFLVCLLFVIGCSRHSIVPENTKTTEHDGEFGASNLRVSEFILGVGDSLEIEVYRQDDLSQSVKIGRSGRFMFPLIGDVMAAGKSVHQLRDEMKALLSKYLVDPQVIIKISSAVSHKVIVLGEINSPGVYSTEAELYMSEGIIKAGGYTQDANIKKIILIRKGEKEARIINFKEILNGDLSRDVLLQKGDIVYVPTKKLALTSRFMSHIASIISPFVNLETGIVLWPDVEEVLKGEAGDTSTIVAP